MSDIDDLAGGAKLRAIDESNCVHRLMNTYEGRAFIWWVIELSGTERSAFAGEATHETAFNEGMKYLGEQTEGKVFTSAEERYILMRTEGRDRQQKYDLADRGEEEQW